MEPAYKCGAGNPCSPPHHHHHHHHHHYHRPLILCPLHPHHHHRFILCPHHHHLILCPPHHHHHFNCQSHVNPSFAPLPPQNPLPLDTAHLQNEFNLGTNVLNAAHDTCYQNQMLQEEQHEGLEHADEEDDEPVFVLTDEWKEFFAKSEAKRKLEKKQAKKKGKN